jgi:hypothetical protein
VAAAYKVHDNHPRPNQALSGGNRPPRVALPTLPARLPIPLIIDPDAWRQTIDGCSFVRKVQCKRDGGRAHDLHPDATLLS